MPSSIIRSRKRLLQPILWGISVFVVGVLASAMVAQRFQGHIRAATASRFAGLHERLRDEVIHRFTIPNYGLAGARGVFAASTSVERKEFQAYVESRDLPHEFPGVLGFGVIKPVARMDLAAFTSAERADGAPDFSVRSSGSDTMCYVMTSVFPRLQNASAWGLDVGSEAVRRRGVDDAIESGHATLTGVITLVQDGERTPGFLLLLPIFRNGTTPTTPVQRHEAVVALVCAPIRAIDLLADLEGADATLAAAEVWEGSPSGDGIRLYPSHAALSAPAAYHHDQVLSLFGRDLHLQVRSTPILDAALDAPEPRLLFAAGTLAAALAAIIILVLGRSRARVLDAAHVMTKDLREAQAAAEGALRDAEVYRATLDQYAIVSMTDAKGRILSVNAAFCAISGYTRDELVGQDHRVLNSRTHDGDFWRAMWTTVQSGRPWRGIICNRAKDGSRYWVDSLITPFAGTDGRHDRIVSIRFDVTAQKLLEQQLQALTERHSLALVAGDVGTWDYDPVNNRLEWTSACTASMASNRAILRAPTKPGK